ncbi:GntR family transcriptional regulator [Mesorhizobium sp. CAU 1741]|uniref:GntR family transcriptional regulator n=1 Tax=Mesorhizobium sp. CAU 1741 TaxID=3140366 RepID=UPI00325C1D93
MAEEKLNVATIDLGTSPSPANVIFDALRQAILHGKLAEGASLRQDALARMFNVSRIPVREALQRLEATGLAASVRYRGVVVKGLNPDEIREIFEFRALLEPDVIRLSVPHQSAKTLEDAAELYERFSTETNPALWSDLNTLFHGALYRDCNRPYYLWVVARSNDLVQRYVRHQLELTDGMAEANKQHADILRACQMRDPDLAAARTRHHILYACERLIDFVSKSRPG